MSSLLNELKKAGLASAKKAKKVEQAKKRLEHLKHKAKDASQSLEGKVKRDETSNPKERLEQLRLIRLEEIYRDAQVSNSEGRRKFYFQTLDNHIECLQISDLTSALIDRGKYAIAANFKLDNYIVIKRANALAIEALDKKRIILLKRQER